MTRTRHTGGAEDVLVQELAVGLARHLFDNVGQKVVIGVAVAVSGTWLEQQRRVAKHGDQRRRSLCKPRQTVVAGKAVDIRNAGGVRQEMVKGNVGSPRVIGNELRNRVLHAEQATFLK